MSRTIFWRCCLVLCAIFLWANGNDKKGDDKRELVFKNLQFISNEFAKEFIPSTKDKSYTNDDINQGIKNLYTLGYFKDIWVKEDSSKNQIIFYFVPKKNLKTIDITGYFKSKKKKMIAKLALEKGTFYSEQKLSKSINFLNDELLKKGFFDSQIIAKQHFSNFGVDVNLSINRGVNVVLEEIHIKGLKHFSPQTIKKELFTKEKSPFSFIPLIFSNGEINLKKLAFNTPKLKEFYLEKGFFDITIKHHQLVIDFSNYTAQLYINIDEGEKYDVNKVAIDLTQHYNDDTSIEGVKEKIEEKIEVQKNDVFKVSDLRKDLATIKKDLGDLGYAFVRIIPDIKKSELAKTPKLNITYKVYLGEVISINDVLIEGNTKTLDYVARREIYLSPGDRFNQKDFDDSIKSLKRTGFFKTVEIEQKPVDIATNKIDLIVRVEEVKGTKLIFGGGYEQGGEGFFVNASFKDLNTLGSGISNKVSMTLSNQKSLYNYNLYNPRIFNSLYSLSFDIYNIDNEYFDFTKKSFGSSVSFGRKIDRHLRLSSTLGVEKGNVLDVDTNTSTDFNKRSIALSSNFDNTDNYLFPTSGIKNKFSINYNYLSSDLTFIKMSNKFGYYKSLKDYLTKEIIFSYNANITQLLNLKDSQIPNHERLFLGGPRSIRGFKSFSIYPENKTTKSKGGEKMFYNNIELSSPLGKSPFRLSAFLDYGFIGNEAMNEMVKGSYGISLGMMTPVGPLAFIFPRALFDRDKSKVGNFEFSIGKIF